jgi:site-specific recombinase XerC
LVAQTCRLLDVISTVDRDDLAISARKGVVTVRRGKGERYRQVPLNAEVRDALDAWLDKRADLPGSNGPALFLCVQGQRLSTRAIDLALRRLG